MSAEEVKEDKKSFARRDQLVENEVMIAKRAVEEHWYEHDAPTDAKSLEDKKKFMVTFPYPYMNGALHLGHAFSLMKAEFTIRFQRLLGKHTLFPFGFHCTGMPILACAQKLQKEVAMFGNPPIFPEEKKEEEKEEEVEEEAEKETEKEAGNADAEAPKEKKRKKKGKAAAKKSGFNYQWQIMREMGVPEDEIAKFCDPSYWFSYFPAIAKTDLNRLGMAIDWRRSFITTDVNPYYDAFVRWQFNQLRAKNKIAYGKLMCICTPSNRQVCADHDRREGEGVTAQAYTLIKLKMLAPYPADLVATLAENNLDIERDDISVILPAATLRPETMYGQTNAFVLPTGTYSIYRRNAKEVFICTDRSALNMSHQDIFESFEGNPFTIGDAKSRKLGEIQGTSLLGCAIKAPLATYEKVYILPLLSIMMDKGTGIVTSVPSDAPSDYAALTDLKNKKEFRNKYGITDEMVLPFEVVPIIYIEELDKTNQVAVTLCQKYGVKSQNDIALLTKAKDEAYKYGFDKGVMIVGEFSGKLVKDIKEAAKNSMIEQGTALLYSEPESRVVSRTDEECVAASIDQWFLTYGEESWKEAIRSHVNSEHFNPVSKSIHSRILFTIGWLKQWGCSRAFGLGTRLPFDEKFLVESLSDSTIYMAYYTIASFLQGGVIDGSSIGTANIKPEQLTDDLFNFVFLDAPYKESIGVSKDILLKMRHEFEFWYPVDLRVSGKDLLNNHLIMSLYNHSAIWDNSPDRMPKSFYANGLLMIDNEKMSKSTGNFLTLAQSLDLYGADATRFALASAGDSLDDANFSSSVADNAILRLTREDVFIADLIQDAKDGKLRDGPLNFWDQVLLNQLIVTVEKTKENYLNLLMMEVIKTGFFELLHIRDEYRLACDTLSMHKDVMFKWAEALLIVSSPILPFWTQTSYDLLQANGIISPASPLIYNAQWPVFDAPDMLILEQANYINNQASLLRGSHAKTQTNLAKKNKGVKPTLTKLTIKVAVSYPGWQQQIIQKLQEVVDAYTPTEEDIAKGNNALSSPDVITAIKNMFVNHPNKKMLTNAMSFTASVKADFAANGKSALQLKMPFDEVALIKEHLPYIVRTLEPITADTVVIESFTPSEEIPATGGAGPVPGKPTLTFGTD